MASAVARPPISVAGISYWDWITGGGAGAPEESRSVALRDELVAQQSRRKPPVEVMRWPRTARDTCRLVNWLRWAVADRRAAELAGPQAVYVPAARKVTFWIQQLRGDARVRAQLRRLTRAYIEPAAVCGDQSALAVCITLTAALLCCTIAVFPVEVHHPVAALLVAAHSADLHAAGAAGAAGSAARLLELVLLDVCVLICSRGTTVPGGVGPRAAHVLRACMPFVRSFALACSLHPCDGSPSGAEADGGADEEDAGYDSSTARQTKTGGTAEWGAGTVFGVHMKSFDSDPPRPSVRRLTWGSEVHSESPPDSFSGRRQRGQKSGRWGSRGSDAYGTSGRCMSVATDTSDVGFGAPGRGSYVGVTRLQSVASEASEASDVWESAEDTGLLPAGGSPPDFSESPGALALGSFAGVPRLRSEAAPSGAASTRSGLLSGDYPGQRCETTGYTDSTVCSPPELPPAAAPGQYGDVQFMRSEDMHTDPGQYGDVQFMRSETMHTEPPPAAAPGQYGDVQYMMSDSVTTAGTTPTAPPQLPSSARTPPAAAPAPAPAPAPAASTQSRLPAVAAPGGEVQSSQRPGVLDGDTVLSLQIPELPMIPRPPPGKRPSAQCSGRWGGGQPQPPGEPPGEGTPPADSTGRGSLPAASALSWRKQAEGGVYGLSFSLGSLGYGSFARAATRTAPPREPTSGTEQRRHSSHRPSRPVRLPSIAQAAAAPAPPPPRQEAPARRPEPPPRPPLSEWEQYLINRYLAQHGQQQLQQAVYRYAGWDALGAGSAETGQRTHPEIVLNLAAHRCFSRNARRWAGCTLAPQRRTFQPQQPHHPKPLTKELEERMLVFVAEFYKLPSSSELDEVQQVMAMQQQQDQYYGYQGGDYGAAHGEYGRDAEHAQGMGEVIHFTAPSDLPDIEIDPG